MSESRSLPGILSGALPFLALLLALTLPGTATASAIYRWVDAEGVVHYSSVAPRGVDYQRVDPGARPQTPPSLANPRNDAPEAPAAEPEPMPAEDSDDDLALTEEQRERQARLQAEANERRTRLARQRQEQCEAARRVYDELTTHTRVRVRGDDGRERVLGEDELQARIARARDAIVTNCD